MKTPNLSKELLVILEKHALIAQKQSLGALIESSNQYASKISELSKSNAMINLKLVKVIQSTIQKLEKGWPNFDADQKRWLSAAINYFIDKEDDSPDLDSFIGFEDDAEVLNACLEFAGREDWEIKIEDYD